MAGSKSVWSLIVIPALITLAVTLLRLVGDLEHWPSPWFSNAAGGGGASVVLSIVGIHKQGGGQMRRKQLRVITLRRSGHI